MFFSTNCYLVKWKGFKERQWNHVYETKTIKGKRALVWSKFMTSGAAFEIFDFWHKKGIQFDHPSLHFTEKLWFLKGETKKPEEEVVQWRN